MNDNPCTNSKRDPQIAEQMKQLTESVMEAFDRICALEGALSPVLRPVKEEPCTPANGKDIVDLSTEQLAPMAEELRNTRTRVTNVLRTVARIFQRLEL